MNLALSLKQLLQLGKRFRLANTNRLVALWFAKAYQDLRTAKALLSVTTDHFEATVFHCQQVVEKSIKGYLAHHKIRFNKTHDIEKLLEQVATVEPVLAEQFRDSARLTKYAVAYRYPEETDVLAPLDRRSVNDVYALSEKIYTTLKEKVN